MDKLLVAILFSQGANISGVSRNAPAMSTDGRKRIFPLGRKAFILDALVNSSGHGVLLAGTARSVRSCEVQPSGHAIGKAAVHRDARASPPARARKPVKSGRRVPSGFGQGGLLLLRC